MGFYQFKILFKVIQKISKFHKIGYMALFVGAISLPIQATEEIIYLQLVNKNKLDNFIPEEKKAAILTRSYLEDDSPEPIQFISEKTKFNWNSKNIEFPQQSSLFLDKIEELKLQTTDYNHLCLTLYAIYQENNNPLELKVVESPLFAREKGGSFFLDEDGCLQKIVTTEFYTKTAAPDGDRWAYFITHNGNSVDIRNDPSIFPITSRSYECTDTECNPICKKFYAHNAENECQHSQNACRHTEPNALFHINKNSIKLFAPLIEEAQDLANIKSIGIRFFSYYQPCSECVDMLHRNRSINIGEGKSFKSSFIFYFNRTYQTPVMKINNEQLQLYNSSNYYLFSAFLSNKFIYSSNDVQEEDKLGKILGYIRLTKKVNLANKDYIFLINYFKDFNFTDLNSFRIYYY